MSAQLIYEVNNWPSHFETFFQTEVTITFLKDPHFAPHSIARLCVCATKETIAYLVTRWSAYRRSTVGGVAFS